MFFESQAPDQDELRQSLERELLALANNSESTIYDAINLIDQYALNGLQEILSPSGTAIPISSLEELLLSIKNSYLPAPGEQQNVDILIQTINDKAKKLGVNGPLKEILIKDIIRKMNTFQNLPMGRYQELLSSGVIKADQETTNVDAKVTRKVDAYLDQINHQSTQNK